MRPFPREKVIAMNIAKDRILRVGFILVCLTALLTLQYARAENIVGIDASDIPMPPTMGLSNVFIDMGKPRFLKARPNAQQFHLFSQGISGESRIYSEELTGHQFFQTGMYFLSAGKINHIRLFGRHDLSEKPDPNHNFLIEAFQIYGKPSAIAALNSIASPTAQAAVIIEKRSL